MTRLIKSSASPTQTLFRVSLKPEHAKTALKRMIPSMVSGFNINTMHGDMQVSGDDARALMELLLHRLKSRQPELSQKSVRGRMKDGSAKDLFKGQLVLHDHLALQTDEDGLKIRKGMLALPGAPEQLVDVKFMGFRPNVPRRKNQDALFEVLDESGNPHHFFSTAFKSLI